MPVLFVEMFGCIGSVEVPSIWVIVVVNQKPATRRLETPVDDWVMKLSFDNFFLRTYDKVFPLLAIAESGIMMNFQMELWSIFGNEIYPECDSPDLGHGIRQAAAESALRRWICC